MAATTRMEPMGKQQRSVHLPPDIYVLAEAWEAKTGHKFNRLVLAALLRFIFEDFDYPNGIWIGLARAVENGSLLIEDIPIQHAQLDVRHWDGMVRRKELREIDGTSLDHAKHELAAAQERLRKWNTRIEEAGDARKAVLQNVQGSIVLKMIEEYDYRTKK